MPSDNLEVLGLIFLLCGVVVNLAFMYRALNRIEQKIDALDDSGTRFSSPIETLGADGKFRKLPRLSRRQPEPEPGGTKVYPNDKEVWDQGLERTEV